MRGSPGRRAFLALGLSTLAGCDVRPDRAFVPGEAIAPEPGSRLRPLGGLSIDRRVLGGGGWSSLVLGDDLTFHAVSDRRRWLSGRLVLDGHARPIALARLRYGSLRDGAGRAIGTDYRGDAESLMRAADGSFVVGFERWARLRRYENFGAPGTYLPAPPGIENAPFNGSLESLALLPDGRWLAIAEQYRLPDEPLLRHAWLGGPAGWEGVAWRTSGENYDPTEARALPDGGLLVLERYFRPWAGFSCRLIHAPPAGIPEPGQGGVLTGQVILRLDDDRWGGNWEAMGIGRFGYRLLVALMTDDNEQWRNPTRLLLYAWDESRE
ncbi:esterase-like activity of phytase family protein [Acetobacteraceae bacterium H6797]|nr:esterase-like activity of phytase family protein [Acetobacteraceae bacterium H6797]